VRHASRLGKTVDVRALCAIWAVPMLTYPPYPASTPGSLCRIFSLWVWAISTFCALAVLGAGAAITSKLAQLQESARGLAVPADVRANISANLANARDLIGLGNGVAPSATDGAAEPAEASRSSHAKLDPVAEQPATSGAAVAASAAAANHGSDPLVTSARSDSRSLHDRQAFMGSTVTACADPSRDNTWLRHRSRTVKSQHSNSLHV